MRVGLIDVDGHNFPNLALMKISAYHKQRGDSVEMAVPIMPYDIVYQAKVFDETYTEDIGYFPLADKVIKGGTGYFKRDKDGIGYVYVNGKWINIGNKHSFSNEVETYTEFLTDTIEHTYPDYSLYPELTKDTAFGFLTRGCPRACKFCIVAGKEGRKSYKVADLSEFHRGQKFIELLDPNILACKDHIDLLKQLVESKAYVNFNQGLDIRCINEDNVALINKLKLKNIHFAWDNAKDDLTPYFERYKKLAKHKPHGDYGTVYVLTNFGSDMVDNLFRIYTLRDMGYKPYVMIYDKPNAPQEVRLLQRWCNNPKIFRTVRNFNDYDRKRG